MKQLQDNETHHLILRDDRIWNRAVAVLHELRHRIVNSGAVFELSIRPYQKTRSTPQNSRFWASLTEYLRHMNQTVQAIASETGHTPLEIKRLIAQEMQPEQVAILFARKPEVAHEVLKAIHDIPTSTRLNTKQFMVYEQRMEQTIAEIAGIVNAFSRKAA